MSMPVASPEVAALRYLDNLTALHRVDGEVPVDDARKIRHVSILALAACRAALEVGATDPDRLHGMDIGQKAAEHDRTTEVALGMLARVDYPAIPSELRTLTLYALTGNFGRIVTPDQFIEA